MTRASTTKGTLISLKLLQLRLNFKSILVPKMILFLNLMRESHHKSEMILIIAILILKQVNNNLKASDRVGGGGSCSFSGAAFYLEVISAMTIQVPLKRLLNKT